VVNKCSNGFDVTQIDRLAAYMECAWILMDIMDLWIILDYYLFDYYGIPGKSQLAALPEGYQHYFAQDVKVK